MKEASNNNKKRGARGKSSKGGYVFSGTVALVYIIIYCAAPEIASRAFVSAINIIQHIIPILVLVFFLIFGINLIPVSMLKKLFHERRRKRAWLMSIIVGVFSHGPVFVWYALLADLRQKGMTNGMAATFIYARAVKLPIIPALVAVFGVKFTVIFYCYILIGALVQGIIIDRIV